MEVIEMVVVDVGDHRVSRRQVKEGSVALVGFRHDQLPLAELRVSAERIDLAADDDRRIEPGYGENGGEHGGGGRLAVRAGDGDADLTAHQLAEHLGARHDRHAEALGLDYLGVVRANGRRHDHDLGSDDVPRLVADRDARAELGQASRGLALGEIRAADDITLVEKHLGDTAHADAADSDEVKLGVFLGMRSHAASA